VMSLKLKALIVTVIVAFGILHIIGATMIQRASGNQSIGAMMLMQNVANSVMDQRFRTSLPDISIAVMHARLPRWVMRGRKAGSAFESGVHSKAVVSGTRRQSHFVPTPAFRTANSTSR
jgi:hypothetical protein